MAAVVFKHPSLTDAVLPDNQPVLRGKVHAISFLHPKGLLEFLKLLSNHITAEVVQRVHIIKHSAFC